MIKKILSYIKLLSRDRKKFYYLIKSIIGFKPRNIELYELALIHKSLLNKFHNGKVYNNERLEYLGDALLGAVVADYLYKKHPYADEGALTKLRSIIVNRNNMNRIAVEIGLVKLIKAQPAMEIENTHVPGDALEAVIGAIFIDRGYDKAHKFVVENIINNTDVDIDNFSDQTNFKSMLIEWGQKNRCEVKFVTEEDDVEMRNGEVFLSFVYVNQILTGTGKGGNKKESQQNAAEVAIKYIDRIRYISYN